MKEFKCKYCGKIFDSASKLGGHITYCKLNPNYEYNLKKCTTNILKASKDDSKRTSKNNEIRDDLFCKYCGKQCKSLNSLRNHERLCKENPNRQILKSNFIAWNEYRRGKNLQKSSNHFKKAKQLGIEYIVSDETRTKLSKASTGRKHTEETKRKISQKMRDVSSKNPSYSNTKYKYTEKSTINGYHLDSSWERIFAEYLIENNIEWNRPKESFEYIFENKKHIYHPDFYLPEFNRYVEIKGQETKRDLAKYEVVKDLIVLKQPEINKIKKRTFDINEYL